MKISTTIILCMIMVSSLFSKGKLIINDNNNIWCSLWSTNGSQIGKFDGKNWTKIEIPGNRVNVLYNMYWHENKLWIASLNGVFHFDGSNWGTYNEEPTYCLAFQNGNIWTGTNDIVRKNKKKFVSFSIADIEVKSMYLSKGYHKFGTSFGLYETKSPKAFVTKTYIKDQKNKCIYDIEMTDNTMYFIIDGGVKTLSNKGWKQTANKATILYNYQNTIVTGGYDNFKVGTHKYLVNGKVTGIDKDKENNLWVFTDEKLYRWNENKMQEINLPK